MFRVYHSLASAILYIFWYVVFAYQNVLYKKKIARGGEPGDEVVRAHWVGLIVFISMNIPKIPIRLTPSLSNAPRFTPSPVVPACHLCFFASLYPAIGKVGECTACLQVKLMRLAN